MERTSSLQSRFYRNGTPSPGQGHVPYDWGFVGTGHPDQGRAMFPTIGVLLERVTLSRVGSRSLQKQKACTISLDEAWQHE